MHASQRGQKVKILINCSPTERHPFISKASLSSQNTRIHCWIDSPADIPAPLPLVWLGVDVGVGLCRSSYMLAVIPVVAMLSGRWRRPPALPGLRRTPPTVFLCEAESAEPGRELEEFSLDKPGSAKLVSWGRQAVIQVKCHPGWKLGKTVGRQAGCHPGWKLLEDTKNSFIPHFLG